MVLTRLVLRVLSFLHPPFPPLPHLPIIAPGHRKEKTPGMSLEQEPLHSYNAFLHPEELIIVTGLSEVQFSQ